jgi:cytochrome P450
MDIDASSPFSKAFDYSSDQIGLRFQNPLYFITEIFTGSNFQKALLEVKSFGEQIVNNAKQRRSHQAFTSLIENSEPEFGSLIDSLMETFSNPHIVADAALNFLSAGRDTTAQSLTWTFYSLMRHPNVITKLRNEHSTAIQKDTSPTAATFQPSNLPYTLAVFYESLRLYPPVPFELRQCLVPTTLPDGTSLPANSIVVWCIWAMNRSVQIWGADAHIFRPERWLDGSGKLITKTASEFPVFNGGPRSCLGKKMAELMVCWVIVKVVRDFELVEVLQLDARGDVKERKSQNSLTLPMEGGLPTTVMRRQDPAETQGPHI